jgi:hypothetical protein
MWPLAIAAALAGCCVQMVYIRNANPNAPVIADRPRGGVIRYALADNLSENQSRREKAYQEMHAYCNGPYRVVYENTQLPPDPDLTYSQPPGVGPKLERAMTKTGGSWYMQFTCVAAETAAPKN